MTTTASGSSGKSSCGGRGEPPHKHDHQHQHHHHDHGHVHGSGFERREEPRATYPPLKSEGDSCSSPRPLPPTSIASSSASRTATMNGYSSGGEWCSDDMDTTGGGVRRPGEAQRCKSGGCYGSGDAHDHAEHDHDDHDHSGGGCCSGHIHGSKDEKPDEECCSDAEECVCNEGCQVNYASLLHQQSGCKRTKYVPSFTSESTAVSDGSSVPMTGGRSDKPRLSCAHCLSNARAISSSLSGTAKACYCKLTRRLCQSVKSLATVEFSKGCCKVNEIQRERDHSHEHGDDHDHNHDHDKPSISEEEDGTTIADPAELSKYSKRLALGVAGMHCTSCAEEIASMLRKVPGIEPEEVQVSFVLARAELKYDPDMIIDVDNDIIHKILKRFPRLDVVTLVNTDIGDESSGIMRVRVSATEGDAKDMISVLSSVDGVESTSVINSNEVEVAYDPDKVGIRTVLAALRRPGVRFGDISLDDVPDGALLAAAAEKRHLRNIAVQTILALILTIPVLVLAWSGNAIKMDEVTRLSIECACATAVILVAYKIYLDAAWAAWFGQGLLEKINMDTLVSVATLAAYAFSVGVFAVVLRRTKLSDGEMDEPFFETSTLLTTLILAGRWVTAGVRSWASNKLRTVVDNDLQTTDVRLFVPEKEKDVQIDARELEYGDVLICSQGGKIATDGLVIDGEGQLDESHLTGEPKPQHKAPGAYLLAGSTVITGEVKFRVSKLLQENTIASIKGMVKLASQQKPKTQQVADTIASVLTPIIFGIAIMVFLIHILLRAVGRGKSWGSSAVAATTYAVATLAISCPCAIALAVPMVMVVASRVGVSKGGFVFKNPAAVEKGPKVRKVAFDKTGTLTTGHLHIDHALYRDPNTGEWATEIPISVWKALHALCRTSQHPVARAMFTLASESHISVRVDGENETKVEVEDVVSQGVQATIENSLYRGGRLKFTAPSFVDDPIVKEHLESLQSVFTLSKDDQLLAMFSLKDDRIRPEVPGVLKALRDRGIEIYIFSGDRAEAVLPIAKELGITRENVFADCYPEDKRARLEILKRPSSQSNPDAPAPSKPSLLSRLNPFRHSSTAPTTVAFIGDGTNDAIALAAADIGIALSQATDMASSSADVAIISDSIAGVIAFLKLAKRVELCIKLNFLWAICWNVFAILGASGAWGKARISPEWAGLGEVGSVAPVFLVSVAVGWGYMKGSDEGEIGEAVREEEGGKGEV